MNIPANPAAATQPQTAPTEIPMILLWGSASTVRPLFVVWALTWLSILPVLPFALVLEAELALVVSADWLSVVSSVVAASVDDESSVVVLSSEEVVSSVEVLSVEEVLSEEVLSEEVLSEEEVLSAEEVVLSAEVPSVAERKRYQ
ncbi:hypothetical protein G6F56_011444 [Rhizopus delemar]|nr:hypothetical protein G6F56_011444 [Rhizopus delemar]